MYSGTFYLDYDGESRYSARVTECVVREGRVVMEFDGADPEEWRYNGALQLQCTNGKCTGRGHFAYADGTVVNATISATTEDDVDGIQIVGSWCDEGDSVPYELLVELEPCGANMR